ncbi:riboflavin kinase [Frankia casuarinae]|uniref:Riboflavin biosynthesis protein n=1 Tax=Frankia casuarinae (strain DSM 45818 / CECT 9043 / HFP020203 / CcI3) TaxID=106370 RepID=Q2J733_FRACC|nr:MULTISPECIES: bifunctional riboflavin kinase/FAD synthetase [Frankia]ABD12909.1 FMN adenylyltransferase / riboflavin kinase [Frankia casuarinae]ETA03512.1 FMN adenylyltransferase /riboflavin kinase [Frankia sp. CcI6]EYT93537.1 riboflavin kinase [Frankia casuarinae]KDA43700.1 riboflavin kinase/FMN adenylyltransferase [Frankia sp. BMG5.23]KFB05231.1 riboflavin kinase/FMN adenylyltransferase [Frankia sp. Allo2]
MQTWRGAENTPVQWRGGVVTIGFFDGVHLGHRQIIGRAVRLARERGERSLVLTFDPHPGEVLRPGSHPALLTTLRFKAELLAGTGVDALCVEPFTLEFSRVSPADFVHGILVERLRASVVVVGENFTYGHRAAGTLATLSEAGAREGFEVDGVRLVRSGEQVLSSTAIRARVAEGDVAAAAAALDRPHRVEGVVVHGDARGRTIGYPTANIQVTPWAAVPADGVYAGFACWSGRRQPAAISIGTNPTFEGRDRRVEAFLLDFDEDLYGEYMAYEFTHRLRPTLRFDSVAELVTQMAADVEATRAATLLV